MAFIIEHLVCIFTYLKPKYPSARSCTNNWDLLQLSLLSTARFPLKCLNINSYFLLVILVMCVTVLMDAFIISWFIVLIYPSHIYCVNILGHSVLFLLLCWRIHPTWLNIHTMESRLPVFLVTYSSSPPAIINKGSVGDIKCLFSYERVINKFPNKVINKRRTLLTK